MATIVTRAGKGSALTYAEADANFTNLNNDKSETTHTHAAVTSGAAGFAPASGGGTTNFLRADGTWAAPSGGGGGGAPQILSWVI